MYLKTLQDAKTNREIRRTMHEWRPMASIRVTSREGRHIAPGRGEEGRRRYNSAAACSSVSR